ncbi:MAG: sugar ABC transporter permease [Lachnospiraceae bacterium]|nr:sugar ABC transporter permease [Lachnospiraceae bacterium]
MKKHISREKRDNITGYLLIAPAVLAIVAIGIVPVIITISYSFEYYLLTDPTNRHFVGFQNYIEILGSSSFWMVLKNTAVFAVISMILELLLGFAGALLMNGARKGTRGVIRTVVLIPWAVPGIIIAYMFQFLFNNQLGPVNVILSFFGGAEDFSWLTKPWSAMLVVIVADAWKQFPYIALMLLAGLQTIPQELYESASIDGAGKVKSFFHITLPNLKGILLIVLLFRMMGAIRIFDIIFGITGGGPASSTSTLLYQAYKYLFTDMNYGKGSAMSTIITVIILAISVLYIRVLGKRDDE